MTLDRSPGAGGTNTSIANLCRRTTEPEVFRTRHTRAQCCKAEVLDSTPKRGQQRRCRTDDEMVQTLSWSGRESAVHVA